MHPVRPLHLHPPAETSTHPRRDHHHGCLRCVPRTAVCRPADGRVSRPGVPGSHRGGLWRGKSRTVRRQRPGQYPHTHTHDGARQSLSRAHFTNNYIFEHIIYRYYFGEIVISLFSFFFLFKTLTSFKAMILISRYFKNSLW